ncbi:hypothetical protein ANO11243_055120 [Dothideomycetidae sp. 11243]|nr:hypothetical protein ANO11243_055120 [fungal sp. No.11243]
MAPMAPLSRGELAPGAQAQFSDDHPRSQSDPQHTSASSSSSWHRPLRKLSQSARKPSHRALRAVANVPTPTTTTTITQRLPARSEKVAQANDKPPSQQHGHGALSDSSLTRAAPVPAISASAIAGDPERHPRRQRKHSHGLSWSNSTCDSLVDNVVSSLDQISTQHRQGTRASLDSHIGPRSTAYAPPPVSMSQYKSYRNRGHAHNASISSETDANDSSGVNGSHGSPHVRRPSALSATRAMSGIKGSEMQSPETHHSRGWRSRHGSKSSEMTASDIASASPSRMHAREASREREHRSRTHSGHDSESILSRGRPVPSAHGSPHAAAPEPNVPSGPASRAESPGPARPNFSAMGSQRAAGPLRKKSSNSRADLTQTPKQETSDEMRTPRPDFARTTSMRSLQQQPPPNSAATTPTGGASKQVGGATDEKRGFFKRVFGSSSSRSNLVSPEMASSMGSPSASRQSSVANTQHGNGQQAAQRQDSSPGPNTARELSKKTSAFFRRQKKAFTDPNEPPSLPPLQPTEASNSESPTRSSLYKAMDPYLAAEQPATSTPVRPQARQATYEARTPLRRLDSSPSSETTDDPELFHSGYNQSPDAAIRQTSPEVDPRRPSEALSAALSGSSVRPDVSMRNMSAAGTTRTNPSHSRNNSAFAAADESAMSQTGSPKPAESHTTKGGIKHSLVVDTSSPRSDRGEFVVSKTDNGQTEVSRVRLIPSPVEPEEDVFVTPHDADTFSPLAKSTTPEPEMTARITSPDDLGLEYAPTASISVDTHAATTVMPPQHLLHVERSNSDATRNMSVATTGTALTSLTAMMEGPNFEDRERALSIYNGDEEHIPREQAAAYLGERKAVNVNTLRAFMDLFNFKDQTVLGGLRMLCNRLVLKAESQQVDRILDCFASRWCECNPEHGFKIKDVVHTMCYSLLLLNTDLHMADIESKMTRAQFVKNTLPTIKRVVADAPPESFGVPELPTPSQRPGMQWQDSTNSVNTTGTADSGGDRRMSTDSRRPTLTKRMSWSLGMGKPEEPEPQESQNPLVPNSGSTALVSEKFDGKPAEWHYELESILKSFFTAIRNEALPLNQKPGVRRTNSLKSMAPSEMSVRSKKTDFMPGRWGRSRVRSKFYASSTMASSRTSFDDGSSLFSPAGSSAWSKLSLGKTLTGTSSDSVGAHYGADQSFPQNIGFANALSQTIAREDGIEDDSMSINAQKFLLEDDSLELAGAPWAKEGIVKHKHHLDSTDKKAKERNWSECFAVIERGYLRLFSFNSKGGKSGSLGVRKSTMHRGKAPSIAPSVVGGGNWMQNAEQLGSFLLRQTIASSLPPPGYSKARPHVWALSLPNGAVHLFQVGTAEIATEFMNTANYWSARLSKEPLVGGVESTEYGWSDNIIIPSMINPALVASAQENAAPSTARGHSRNNSVSTNRLSAAVSGRGSVDHTNGVAKSPRIGDKASIEGWKPPAQSMMASQLMEVDQLKALKDYVVSIESDLSKHNELRLNIPNAYSPRHPNLGRAIANWENKSAFLLREIVKFRTYIDALNLAGEEKQRIDKDRAERAAEKEEREQRKRERDEAAAAAAKVASAAAEEEQEAQRNVSVAAGSAMVESPVLDKAVVTEVEATPKPTPFVSAEEVPQVDAA